MKSQGGTLGEGGRSSSAAGSSVLELKRGRVRRKE